MEVWILKLYTTIL